MASRVIPPRPEALIYGIASLEDWPGWPAEVEFEGGSHFGPTSTRPYFSGGTGVHA